MPVRSMRITAAALALAVGLTGAAQAEPFNIFSVSKAAEKADGAAQFDQVRSRGGGFRGHHGGFRGHRGFHHGSRHGGFRGHRGFHRGHRGFHPGAAFALGSLGFIAGAAIASSRYDYCDPYYDYCGPRRRAYRYYDDGDYYGRRYYGRRHYW